LPARGEGRRPHRHAGREGGSGERPRGPAHRHRSRHHRLRGLPRGRPARASGQRAEERAEDLHPAGCDGGRGGRWGCPGRDPHGHTFPHTRGADGAGVVAAVGTEVRSVRLGDRVMLNPGISDYTCEYCRAGEHSLCVNYRMLGEHLPGTLCESVIVPEQNVAIIPTVTPPLNWAEAAAFSLVTLTAWRMVVTRAQLRAGETILIWGIGGGVSLTALRIAKLRGARVIVTSSSDAKLETARRLGGDVTLHPRTQQ